MSSGTVEGKTVRNIVRGYTIETDFIDCKGYQELSFS